MSEILTWVTHPDEGKQEIEVGLHAVPSVGDTWLWIEGWDDQPDNPKRTDTLFVAEVIHGAQLIDRDRFGRMQAMAEPVRLVLSRSMPETDAIDAMDAMEAEMQRPFYDYGHGG